MDESIHLKHYTASYNWAAFRSGKPANVLLWILTPVVSPYQVQTKRLRSYYTSTQPRLCGVTSHVIFEPKRQKTYRRTCAPCEDSDQPAHPRSLIRIFTGRILVSQGCKSSSCGQTKTLIWLRSLILVFVGRTRQKVCFRTLRRVFYFNEAQVMGYYITEAVIFVIMTLLTLATSQKHIFEHLKRLAHFHFQLMRKHGSYSCLFQTTGNLYKGPQVWVSWQVVYIFHYGLAILSRTYKCLQTAWKCILNRKINRILFYRSRLIV